MAGGPSPSSGTPRNLFAEQAANKRKTWLLIGGFILLLAFIGFGFDLFVLGYDASRPLRRGQVPIPMAALVAIAFGGVSSWFGYRFGDRVVLAGSGARPVQADDPQARVLMNVVTEMSIASGLPMPKVYVLDDADPNAFATGRDPEHASIAVTTGLLMVMSRDELQGVIAHEMSHVRNYDIRTMTIVAALLGAVLLLSDIGARVRFQGGRRSDDDDRGGGLSGPLGLLVLVLWLVGIILAPIIGQLLATA